MPLPLKDRKIGAVEYVIKRLKGSDSYDRMKDHNESAKGADHMQMRTKPEADYSEGLRQAVQELMQAAESKDASTFQSSLQNFVSMMVESAMEDHNMQYHAEEHKEMMGKKED